MSAKLSTGSYIITTAVNNSYVGRQLVEDRSLNPKKVFILSKEDKAPYVGNVTRRNLHKVEAHFSPPQKWNIEALPGDRYRLKNGGGAVGVFRGRIYSFLMEEEDHSPEEWVITPRPQNGINVYT